MNLERNEVIKKIKTALQRRSGKQWSVTGGRGTAWGWLTIDAPPTRRTWGCRLKADASPAELPEDYERYDTGEPDRTISPQDAAELAKLLALDSVHDQGVKGAALPVAIMPEDRHACKEGICYLFPSDLTSSSGSATRGADGNISLYVHSNCQYALHIKEATAPVVVAELIEPDDLKD